MRDRSEVAPLVRELETPTRDLGRSLPDEWGKCLRSLMSIWGLPDPWYVNGDTTSTVSVPHLLTLIHIKLLTPLCFISRSHEYYPRDESPFLFGAGRGHRIVLADA
jgi:hypothetical protein